MPAQSKAQQRFMGMVHATQKGDMEAPSKEVEKAADSMTDKAAKDFASTKHKGLPGHVKKENKIDLEDEDLPSAVLPVSAENTMKGYDASCGCFRTESADVNQNAVMASIEDLPNNRTQKNFPLPTNRVLWNATGKVCEGRPVVERIKMYEKKGGGWREGVKGDEQVFNSLKELYYERKQMESIKENIRQVLRKKKITNETLIKEDISDVVMNGLQMIGIFAGSFFLRFLIRYMIGEFLKSSKDTTMSGIKSIIQGVKNAWSSLKNMSRIHQLEKELENDEDIKHAVSHPRTVDFAKVLKQKLDPKDYDLISKITRNNFR